jgi:hypothetical protein
MRTFSVRKATALSAAALLAVSLGAMTTAQGSEYPQDNGPVLTNPVNWTPNLVEVAGQQKPVAYSVDQEGSNVVVVGRFTRVENNLRTIQYDRNSVFAFSTGAPNVAPGTVDPNFHPDVQGGEVWSVLINGDSVYIGGGFTTVNGVARPIIAKLSLATGELDPNFNPTYKGGKITDMAMYRGMLVISGAFTQRLKTLDPDTGKQLPYMSNVITGKLPNISNPPAGSGSIQVFKFDISPDGQHLVAVGNFLQVNGVDRPRMFMLDLGATSATLSPWNYPPNGVPCTSGRANAQMYIQDVDFAPDSSWFAVAAFGFQFQTNWNGQNYYGRQLCDSVSRFETSNLSPQRPSWINYTGGDSLKSVAVTNKAVYVQGHSRWLDNPVVTNGVTNPKNGNPQPGSYPFDRCGTGCVSQPGGGAVDPATGLAIWNPVMPQESGGYKILTTADGVWFATDGQRFGHEYRRGIRFAPLP